MKELLPTIDAWRTEGVGCGAAVLVRVFGSGPRPPGATLLVADDGRIAGSVSGGCVESACFEEIRRARHDGLSRVVRYGITDEQAWDVGLACGSTIDVLIEAELRPELEAAARRDEATAVVIPLPDDSPGPGDGPHPPAAGVPTRALVVGPASVGLHPSGEVFDEGLAEAARAALLRGQSGVVARGDRQFFAHVFPVPPRLIVFGAVQVAMPLVRMAHEIGYRTVVVDARAAFATRERFPEADQIVVGWPDEVAVRLTLAEDDAVAVLTHDPKLDEPAIVAALRADCGYVGAIGSRRTQAGRRARLAAAGVPESALRRLRGPIGLDLGGREPPEIALAILAEVVAARHGAIGGSLHARAEPAAVAGA